MLEDQEQQGGHAAVVASCSGIELRGDSAVVIRNALFVVVQGGLRLSHFLANKSLCVWTSRAVKWGMMVVAARVVVVVVVLFLVVVGLFLFFSWDWL